ncbi:hypothetical protein [Atopococcus tabaci]|uniref:hypothetical protein n=1 Tax=Atopococcus tabaci TaxID=269774 RepID=UPI002409C208|nr:hypothetical protein [Atopococcus tabaci]
MIDITREYHANMQAVLGSKLSAEKKQAILNRLIAQLEVLCETDSKELSPTVAEVTQEEKTALRQILTTAVEEAQKLIS